SLCSFMTPQLTTINFPTDRMAEAAVKILLEKINNPEVKIKGQMVLPLELIIRESTSKISK
ncbi:MAG: substrate-binding domain-containing protein, partial [Actinomycetia bacterium]|nr:substrate-binding domain-containing protein [Actinomycetes bacterium]